LQLPVSPEADTVGVSLAIPSPLEEGGGALQLWLTSITMGAPSDLHVHVGVAPVPVLVLSGMTTLTIEDRLRSANVPGLGSAQRRRILAQYLQPATNARDTLARFPRGIFEPSTGIAASHACPPSDIFNRDGLGWSEGQMRYAGIRRVLAAAGKDLLSRPYREISARLGLEQHRRVPGLHDHAPPKPRRAMEYAREGRTILRAVGAWPWVLFAGALPPRWWEEPAVVLTVSWWLEDEVARLERIRDMKRQRRTTLCS